MKVCTIFHKLKMILKILFQYPVSFFPLFPMVSFEAAYLIIFWLLKGMMSLYYKLPPTTYNLCS